tara:strand:- start:2168 stop:2479 length:312 start_codon:yes stop_codon:yes gene_type:complete
MIDWVAFFTQYPYLIEGIEIWIIWMQWGIAFGFIIAYPLMYPFNYMFLRSDNFQYDDGTYFRDAYPTYRSYAFRSVPYWRWKYISMPLWHLDNSFKKIVWYYG